MARMPVSSKVRRSSSVSRYCKHEGSMRHSFPVHTFDWTYTAGAPAARSFLRRVHAWLSRHIFPAHYCPACPVMQDDRLSVAYGFELLSGIGERVRLSPTLSPSCLWTRIVTWQQYFG